MSTTSAQRQIRFNAFDMNCVGHQSPGLWKHPKDQSARYKDLSYWTDLAKTLEKGKFDGIFIADVLGTYDVFGGSNEVPLRAGTQVPVNDPMMLVSAMAAVTEHLGFGVTAGTAYEHPYPFARRLATLDHLTKGRVGWNVVTGYLPSAARNMGQEDQLEHDERYNHADEYMEVIYKLLEGSWEEDAVVRDVERGIFTDPTKVHEIKHEGKYFKVPGIAITEPSPQRTPVVFQAGASPRGLKFASENAEAVFVTSPTKEILKETVTKIRDAAEAAGRGRYDVRIYAMQTIVTGPDSASAEAKFEDYKSYADIDGALALISGWMGVDLSTYGPDDVIGDNVKSNAIQSSVATFQKASGDDGNPWTIRQLAEWVGVGGFGPITVGSGAEVAEKLIDWVAETDVDGFNLAYAITPGTFEDVVEFVVPELQARGAYQSEYVEGTLRNKLFGKGDRVQESHKAANYRLSAAKVG
ncbi:LLM class flavin-dependent oxidoreductase [Paeniglutamicibacter kerguelensis]|uniref:FMN-dependent oxidoreductase (Nitrilotriacetate monooxygenase family) n=1 Tax=Paeniglutamicibacter kerguelensis TaxID=254788 RepID=A0ABS4XJT5_9MICC|nr:LLM class flavin-dependent oxidoreductase [Paeniglutamicibacter kerguelensis]MBP2388715.1 FMN-dependent oxidoreductase (nitrilotriacetate monooxygenase family) [Paeniglutamicibacter kerguelensis]